MYSRRMYQNSHTQSAAVTARRPAPQPLRLHRIAFTAHHRQATGAKNQAPRMKSVLPATRATPRPSLSIPPTCATANNLPADFMTFPACQPSDRFQQPKSRYFRTKPPILRYDFELLSYCPFIRKMKNLGFGLLALGMGAAAYANTPLPDFPPVSEGQHVVINIPQQRLFL